MTRARRHGRKLAKLAAGPSIADPEDLDGTFDQPLARDSDDDYDKDDADVDEDIAMGVSKLRGDAAMDSREWGGRYSSQKVSRGAITDRLGNEEELDEEEEEEEEDDESEENNDVDQEESDEQEELDDEEESDEEESDEEQDEDEKESDENEKNVAVQRSVFRRVEKRSVDEELAFLEAEDREQQQQRMAEEVLTTSQRRTAQQAKKLLNHIDRLFQVRIVQQRISAVINEQSSTQAISLAIEDREHNEDKDELEEFELKRRGTLRQSSTHIQRVLQALCSLRENLRLSRARRKQENGEEEEKEEEEEEEEEERSTHIVDNYSCSSKSRKKRNYSPNDEEVDDTEDESVSDDAALKDGYDVLLGDSDSSGNDDDNNDGSKGKQNDASGKRQERLQEIWEGISAGFDRCRPFWEDTLETWQRRAAAGAYESKSKQKKRRRMLQQQEEEGGAASVFNFKVVHGQKIFEQVEGAINADELRALKKAHPIKERLDSQDDDNDGDESESNEDEDEVNDDSGSGSRSKMKKIRQEKSKGSLDLTIFDDGEFYHRQLKEFLATRGSFSGGVDEESAQHAINLATTARKRRTKNNGVDTRASKGRKLRYEPLPKLENFMFPEPGPPPPLNADSLFRSLFAGKR